jgi:hypothetical protein
LWQTTGWRPLRAAARRARGRANPWGCCFGGQLEKCQGWRLWGWVLARFEPRLVVFICPPGSNKRVGRESKQEGMQG